MAVLNQLANDLITSDKPVIKTIYDLDGHKTLAIGLAKGVTLKEHSAPGKATLIVIQGTIDFFIDGKTHRLKKHDTFSIPLRIKHALKGVDNAIFLLVMDIVT